MKVIHLAAFRGNSGDLFSHAGFQSMFRALVDPDADFTRVELREFYHNACLRQFDEAFLREINRHDLFVIGGGQFFDVRWDYSNTGTTLDFSDGFINAIECPVVVNGIGYAEPQEGLLEKAQMDEIFKKFKMFISAISRKKWLLTLRNDGSYSRIEKRFGREMAELFTVVPDNGFYFDTSIEPFRFNEVRPTVGLNIANDQFFHHSAPDNFIRRLNTDIAAVITGLIQRKYRILILPHMPRDLEVIYRLYELVGERAFRFNISVAPYNPQDENAARQLVSYYKACDITLAMRFHSNVISIANAIPSVGLAVEGIVSEERVRAMYSNMGLDDFSLTIRQEQKNIFQQVMQAFEFTVENAEAYVRMSQYVMEDIKKIKVRYAVLIKDYLQNKDVSAAAGGEHA